VVALGPANRPFWFDSKVTGQFQNFPKISALVSGLMSVWVCIVCELALGIRSFGDYSAIWLLSRNCVMRYTNLRFSYFLTSLLQPAERQPIVIGSWWLIAAVHWSAVADSSHSLVQSHRVCVEARSRRSRRITSSWSGPQQHHESAEPHVHTSHEPTHHVSLSVCPSVTLSPNLIIVTF